MRNEVERERVGRYHHAHERMSLPAGRERGGKGVANPSVHHNPREQGGPCVIEPIAAQIKMSFVSYRAVIDPSRKGLPCAGTRLMSDDAYKARPKAAQCNHLLDDFCFATVSLSWPRCWEEVSATEHFPARQAWYGHSNADFPGDMAGLMKRVRGSQAPLKLEVIAA